MPELPDFNDQGVIDAAWDNARATSARHAETERAHAAGLITLDRPDAAPFYVTGDAVPYGDSAVPDASVSAQHNVRTGRNKRGTTRVVTARGVPYVTGDRRVTAHGTAPDCGPYGPDDAVVVPFTLALALDPESPYGRVRARRVGVNALDITALTNAVYGPLGLPALLGSDAESWSEVIPGDRSTALAMAPFAGHVDRAMSTRTVEVPQVDGTVNLVDQGWHHGPESTARHIARVRLPRIRARKAERALLAPRTSVVVGTYRGSWHGRVIAPVARVWTVTPCLASADGTGATAFYGLSRATMRPGPVRARVKRAARTIGTVRADEITTPDGWQAVVDLLDAGQRVVVETARARVTITRARNGRFSARIVTPDASALAIKSARTSTAIARRLALSTA